MSRPPGHTGPVSAVQFQPVGDRLAPGSYDGTVRLWDAASGGDHPGTLRRVRQAIARFTVKFTATRLDGELIRSR